MLEGDATTQALEEYKQLREEVLSNDRLCLQCIAIVLSATGVILGQGLVSGRPWVFLIPLPLLWSMYYYVSDKRFATWVIASYIVVHLEARLPGLNWETRLRLFRGCCNRSPARLVPGQNPMLNELVLFNLLTVLSGVLFARFAESLFWGILPLALWVGFLVFSLRIYLALTGEGRQGDLLVTLWEESDRAA